MIQEHIDNYSNGCSLKSAVVSRSFRTRSANEPSYPASTTHRQLSDAQKVQAGAGSDVVRLSIGIEDTDDIIADLDQALAA